FDDAGVYKLTDDIALVQTVDLFTPIVDNPYSYGQISAANSLSDVYAMGGKPVTALNIAGFPKNLIPLETLAEIIKGAVDKTGEVGCPIVGGHTITDDELKFGLSVTGVVHPDRIITNANSKPGDKLILTKPLGMGILTTALKAGKLEEETLNKAVSIMSELNNTASEIMVSFKAHAATDITGFGLLGHAYEMANAGNVSITFYADQIPYLKEALLMTKEGGYIPAGTVSNKTFLEKHVTFTGNIDNDEQMIFFDAQTSGGLLISISSGSADECLKAMQDKDVTYAAVIGEVTSEEKEKIKVIK
ncbi:MAG TPA: selenide, water dikinase SelD, partial [bacterium]|nr:selenide, water dikinase SelD [bacterium]